jgi:NAD(P)-dependent dehydrogenase (short-subunit alcohol dehydrogenase family)
MGTKLKGKVAVITGGTTGIGLATARLFHDEGAVVVVTGQSAESVSRASAELGGVAEVIRSDAGDAGQVRDLMARVARDRGGIDVLFLNAGIGRFGPITDLAEAAFDEVVKVNFKGPWLAIKHAVPFLRSGAAVLVNTSVTNQLGMPGSSAYAASKAALRSLVRTAAAELVERGVRVNAVSPGPIETPIYGKLGMPKEAVEAFSRAVLAKVPQQRFGRPEEIARAALFLASDDASFVTGGEIAVDGGMTQI